MRKANFKHKKLGPIFAFRPRVWVTDKDGNYTVTAEILNGSDKGKWTSVLLKDIKKI